MKDTLTEMKNNLQGINSRADEAQNQINDLEHKEKKKQKTTNQNNKKKKESNKMSISSLWDNFKRSNIHTVGVLEGEEKEQETGNLFEKIVKEKFPNLVKEIDMQVQ